MQLNAEFCYRAMMSRDPRFDGRFFIAVVTTGIYCRPVCPARKPRFKNVRFIPTAAAAEAAGFRPCLRCKPEFSVGTPQWNGTPATITRAFRYIDSGFLDEKRVADLASEFGLTDRHLRRLFEEHLGASPVQLALTRRLHFARNLLRQTVLPVTDIAFASGFGSLRRFNSAFKKAYHSAPTIVRKQAEVSTLTEQSVQLRLNYRPPYDWRSLIEFFSNRAIADVEDVSLTKFRRALRFGSDSGVIEVEHCPDQHCISLSIPRELSKQIMALVESAKVVFDLKADPEAIYETFSKDRYLGEIVRSLPGLRVPGAWNWFEIAVRAILGQQVTVKAARTLAGRVVQRLGGEVSDKSGSCIRHFPEPEAFLNSKLDGIGVPQKRIDAIHEIAKAVSWIKPPALSSGLDEIVKQLCSLPGIGPWTAHYIALRGFGEPDSFPPGDLVLKQTASKIAGRNLTDSQLQSMSESWRPWRSYAVIYLWALSNANRKLETVARQLAGTESKQNKL